MAELDSPELPVRLKPTRERSGTFNLLFVCTGNICRSPTAELLLSERLRLGLGPGAERFEVHSAGSGTSGLQELDPTIEQMLHERGVGHRAVFRSRPLCAAVVDKTDLIITATKAHRLTIGADYPTAYRRCFTMREAATLLRDAAPPAVEDDPVDRAHELVRQLQRVRGTRLLPEDQLDIADPYRQRTAAYRRMIQQVSEVVDALAAVLAPLEPHVAVPRPARRWQLGRASRGLHRKSGVANRVG